MSLRISFLIVSFFFSFKAYNQLNFTYSPEKPKPGDLITITYEPAGAIANTLKPVEGKYYTNGYSNIWLVSNLDADDLVLTRSGKKYIAKIQTNPKANFIYFGFSSGNKFDNNSNNGYYILLNDGDKVSKGAYKQLANLYEFFGERVGLDRENEKALLYTEKEISLYPEERQKNITSYFSLLNTLKKPELGELVQKEIESVLKSGLKTEEDYKNLEEYYKILKLPEQSKLISSVKKERFPNGKWTVFEKMNKFFQTNDPAKAELMVKEIEAHVEKDSNWSYVKSFMISYKIQPLNAYFNQSDWMGLQKALQESTLSQRELSPLYNQAAWAMQKTNSNLDFAEELIRKATLYTRTEYENPNEKKPIYETPSEWKKKLKANYVQYAHTYAMVLFRQTDFKNAFKYIKEVVTLDERKNSNHNNTYATVAEKVMPLKKYKMELEEFVRNGKAGKEVKEVLKRAYVITNKSEQGFEDYLSNLEKEAYNKMIVDLRNKMLNDAVPSFTLLDLDNKEIDIADLKGKIVIVDFWATWCGPCIGSFPSMQKMVNKYKNDSLVKFVFIDTWEKGDNKEKNARELINKSNYSFQVLMDNESKVVEQFKVDGIPAKFIIDKNGIIRFKSLGHSEEKLEVELTAMIELIKMSENHKR